MADLLRSVALVYSIPMQRIVTLKAEKVFALLTAKESYILKKTAFSPAENQFLTAALLHLKNRGFQRFNELIPTREGKYIADIGSERWFLTKALPGRTPDYNNAPDAASIGAYFGELHRATEGFFPEPAWECRNKWGKMLRSMETAAEELQSITEIVRNKQEKDEFDFLFLSSVGDFCKQIKNARAELAPIYEELWQEQYKKGGFIHHDPAHHNFVIDARGQVAAFDFDYAVADFAVHDVAALLLKICKRNRWQLPNAMAAFEAYEEIRPLSLPERRAIRALLQFPYDYYRAAFARYFEGNRSRHIKNKLLRSLEELSAKQEALRCFTGETEG